MEPNFFKLYVFCRDYNVESERQKSVEEFYRVQHINQTYDYVSSMPSFYNDVVYFDKYIWYMI